MTLCKPSSPDCWCDQCQRNVKNTDGPIRDFVDFSRDDSLSEGCEYVKIVLQEKKA